jgi:phosphoribosylaminoimidazole-succinocarboxamide synthase
MRPCSACVSRLILYQMSDASNYYVEYYRINRRYELASPMVKIKRLGAKADALREQSLKAERKAIRLRKQTRALYKKIRKLDNRKNQNILDLKIEEKMEEAAKRTLNTPLDPSELPNSAPTLEFPPNLAGFS